MQTTNKTTNSRTTYKVTSFTATDNEIGKTCSICGTGILNDESVVLCPKCSLPYHYECWKEMGGCGSYGCAAAPNIKKAEYSPSDTYIEGWTSKKKCPECGELILSNALICYKCKSKFPTEKPMTKEQWINRIYDGKDLLSVKILTLLQFILSLIIVLDIFMFPINIYTICLSDKLWWFFKMKRLPIELKILQYFATIISIINLILLLFIFLIIKNGN